MNFEKLLGQQSFKKTTTAIRFNFLQVCTSVPSFARAVLFIPSFNVLIGYFTVSLSMVTALAL